MAGTYMLDDKDISFMKIRGSMLIAGDRYYAEVVYPVYRNQTVLSPIIIRLCCSGDYIFTEYLVSTNINYLRFMLIKGGRANNFTSTLTMVEVIASWRFVYDDDITVYQSTAIGFNYPVMVPNMSSAEYSKRMLSLLSMPIPGSNTGIVSNIIKAIYGYNFTEYDLLYCIGILDGSIPMSSYPTDRDTPGSVAQLTSGGFNTNIYDDDVYHLILKLSNCVYDHIVFDFDVKTREVSLIEVDSTSGGDIPFNLDYNIIEYFQHWCIELLSLYSRIDNKVSDVRSLSIVRTMDDRLVIEFRGEFEFITENFDLIAMSMVSSVIGHSS
jgi:hypothetical protein